MEMPYYYDINNTERYCFTLGDGLELQRERENKDGETELTAVFIGNFIPIVINPVNMHEEDKVLKYANVILKFIDGAESEVEFLPIMKAEKIDWSNDIDSRCILNPSVPRAREHLGNLIRLQCSRSKIAPEQVTVVNQLGGHIIEDVAVFHVGDHLIWPTNLSDEEKPKVSFTPVPNTRLSVNPNCSEEDACKGMLDIVNLSPDAGRAIFALNLLCVQWCAFVDAGIRPQCNLLFHGHTGYKKTTYASFCSQLYNRDKPLESPNRLNASVPAVVELMRCKRHGVLILDDLYPADSPEIYRKQEDTLLEAIRISADGTTPARMKGNQISQKPPCCCILATGEYYIGGGSDASRIFPLEIKTPIDDKKLSACQAEPLMLSTFYNFYLEWYVTNYSDIVHCLKEWKDEYRGRTHETGVHARLRETEFCLRSAYKIFLSYCCEKGFSLVDLIQSEDADFHKQLVEITVEQNDRSKNCESIKTNYLSTISSIYRANKFNLVDEPKHFEEGVHDGVLHKGCLYFREAKLMEKIRFSIPDANFKDVVAELKWRCVLCEGKSTTTQQLHNAGKGVRFYVIRLSGLT